jgi:hypothetical protein
MSVRRRISTLASAIIVGGTLALTAPSTAAARESARLCELKCPSIPGFVFCGGECDDSGNSRCSYANEAGNCPQT